MIEELFRAFDARTLVEFAFLAGVIYASIRASMGGLSKSIERLSSVVEKLDTRLAASEALGHTLEERTKNIQDSLSRVTNRLDERSE